MDNPTCRLICVDLQADAVPDRAPDAKAGSAARQLPPLFRLAASLGLMAAVLFWLEPQTLAAAFVAPEPLWLAAALALSVPQVALSAWRWRLTAQRLGAPIRFGEALREYYVATFLNQVLPGGVMGDAARAWRHARLSRTEAMDGAPVGLAAWHAVLIERASGQLALLGVVLATLLVAVCFSAVASVGFLTLFILSTALPLYTRLTDR
mgnify:CR=1 FL=1